MHLLDSANREKSVSAQSSLLCWTTSSACFLNVRYLCIISSCVSSSTSTISTCGSGPLRSSKRVEGTVEAILEMLLPDDENEFDTKPGISSRMVVTSAD